ncbi:hypothetical protein B0H14DRAFT_2559948 [Mycena olivaceomarginata]|nr:hypothetical protein B0H14DRAFT_2559948 [Mycena olivaceomarginata]
MADGDGINVVSTSKVGAKTTVQVVHEQRPDLCLNLPRVGVKLGSKLGQKLRFRFGLREVLEVCGQFVLLTPITPKLHVNSEETVLYKAHLRYSWFVSYHTAQLSQTTDAVFWDDGLMIAVGPAFVNRLSSVGIPSISVYPVVSEILISYIQLSFRNNNRHFCSALGVNKYPENIPTKFVLLTIRKREESGTSPLSAFEYQKVHHYMKESDILAKRHEYVGAALLVTKVIGEQNLIRATPVVLTVEDLGQAEEEKTLTGVLAVHPLVSALTFLSLMIALRLSTSGFCLLPSVPAHAKGPLHRGPQYRGHHQIGKKLASEYKRLRSRQSMQSSQLL